MFARVADRRHDLRGRERQGPDRSSPAGHVGVVVTAGEVFVSWAKPLGAASATVTVRRGEPACPRHPDEGSAAGEVTPLHVIDRTVSAGQAYCYTGLSPAPPAL